MTLLLGENGSAALAEVESRVIVGMSLESAGGSVDLLSWPYRMVSFVGLTGGDTDAELDYLPGVDGGFVVGADSDGAGLSLAAVDGALTVLVDAGSPLATSLAVESLRRVLSSRRYGPASLVVTRSNGEARRLPVRHVPKAGDFDPMRQGGSLRPVTVRLLAPSPLWRGASGSAGPWGVGGGGGGTTPVTFPFYVATSRVLGSANPVLVGGDENTYPTLTVSASFSAVTVSRGDGRGYTLTAPSPVLAGQVVIRHDPTSVLGGVQVQGPDGSSWARYLSPGADLFELRPGEETLSLVVTGSSASTTAWLEWPTLFWSAV